MVEEEKRLSRFRRHGGVLGRIEGILLICIPISGVVTILDVFLYFGISVWVEQYLAVFLGLIMTVVPLIVPATKGIKDPIGTEFVGMDNDNIEVRLQLGPIPDPADPVIGLALDGVYGNNVFDEYTDGRQSLQAMSEEHP